MSAPTPYLYFPGTTRDALEYYAEVFGGTLELHTREEMGRKDGPGDAIGHGVLRGPVDLYASDVSGEQEPLAIAGLQLALLGVAEPTTLRSWFARLAADGEVIDELSRRPWGASDGQVRDRFGLTWLIGYEHGEAGDLAPAVTFDTRTEPPSAE
ncbi:MAG: VOC family protein [Brachybacterium sp.]|nr:VOC family protein [Brachybacterium sp.]